MIDAYAEFRDFVTEDRFFGPLAPTTILNHHHRKHRTRLTKRDDEGLYVGFHRSKPTLDEITDAISGKRFLNFDDISFNEDMRGFLDSRFPEPCPYECFEEIPTHSSSN